MQINQSLYNQRRRKNAAIMAFSGVASLIGLAVLVWILFVLFSNGFYALDWEIFTQDTPAPGTPGGGLRNAIVGSLIMVGCAVLISTPIGVLAGIYLAEFGDANKTASVTRFVNEVMLSAPSVVLGLFVFAVVVMTMGHFSGYAGMIALSLIAIPVVIKTTENMMRMIPGSSPACCWRWRASVARPRRCSLPRSTTSSSPSTWTAPWPTCRSGSTTWP